MLPSFIYLFNHSFICLTSIETLLYEDTVCENTVLGAQHTPTSEVDTNPGFVFGSIH